MHTPVRQPRVDGPIGVFVRMAQALMQRLTKGETGSKRAIDDAPGLPPRVEVSWGELLDKITILEIKMQRLTAPASVANVRHELEQLTRTVASLGPLSPEVEAKRRALRAINEKLWDVEDAIRACEAEQRFDAQFVALARSVYVLNDERGRIKRDINAWMKSPIVEEKEYRSY